MKVYLDIGEPDEKERVPVVVTAVHEDGSYDYKGEYCSGYRAVQTLYDESGVEVQPSVESQEITPELLEALKILLGGE